MLSSQTCYVTNHGFALTHISLKSNSKMLLTNIVYESEARVVQLQLKMLTSIFSY